MGTYAPISSEDDEEAAKIRADLKEFKKKLRAGGLVLVDAEGKEVNVEALRTTTQPDGDGKIIMIVMEKMSHMMKGQMKSCSERKTNILGLMIQLKFLLLQLE